VSSTEAVADIDLLEHQESCGEYRQAECGTSREVLQVIGVWEGFTSVMMVLFALCLA